MRAANTYRAHRRNTYRTANGARQLDTEFKRVSGKNFKQAFDDDVIKYDPPETSGYWPNREDLKHAGKLED